MSDKAKRVLSAWLSLTSEERAEALRLVNEFINGSNARKQQITTEALDSVNQLDFGPLKNSGAKCPYCGK